MSDGIRKAKVRLMLQGKIIAIDGPVASGKGTIAPQLAKHVNGFYLPTGAMYRCVVLYADRQNILSDRQAIIQVLPRIRIEVQDERVLLNGEDVTEQLKQNAISKQIHRVAGIPEVRKALVEIMQRIGKDYRDKGKIVIVEGRDIGTVVFPEAEVKLYLTATPAVRARRRLEQLHAQGDTQATYTEVFAETIARDTYDQEETKSLVTDPEKAGYVVFDSSELQEKETLERVERLLRQKGILT